MNSNDQAQKILEKIKDQRHPDGSKIYLDDQPENHKVELLADNKIERGKFLPNRARVNSYWAHQVTIRAIKKDIFVLSEEELLLIDQVECQSCHKILDKQYWHFCPFCESNL